MKKIKLRNNKKNFKVKYVLCLFIVFIISIGIAYSKFSTDLNIFVSVNGTLPMGNSKYTLEHRSTWPNSTGGVIHDVHLSILNLDEDYTENLVITFQVNDGFNLEDSTNNLNVWQADSIVQEGNTVSLVMKSYASWLPIGNTLDLYFQMPYSSGDIIPEITKVTIGGYRARYVQEF